MMTFFRVILIVVMSAWIAACAPVAPVIVATDAVEATQTSVVTEEPTEAFTPTPEPGLTIEHLKNSVFFAPESQQAIQLTDGKFEGAGDNGAIVVEMLPQVAIGDLNDDNVDDAALLLAETMGGTGVFVSLIIITSDGEGYLQAGEVFIDDRPKIDSVTIEDGSVFFEGSIHRFDDILAQPTLAIQRTYQVLEGTVTLTRQSRINPDGTESLINISAPLHEDGISNPVQITGNMPIAPFESNLAFTVYDLKGKVLYQSGFMVTAAEVGAPATFSNLVNLPALPFGAWVRLELAELSMADGSLMTMDSVVVQIQ
jgi:hypothetical protein